MTSEPYFLDLNLDSDEDDFGTVNLPNGTPPIEKCNKQNEDALSILAESVPSSPPPSNMAMSINKQLRKQFEDIQKERGVVPVYVPFEVDAASLRLQNQHLKKRIEALTCTPPPPPSPPRSPPPPPVKGNRLPLDKRIEPIKKPLPATKSTTPPVIPPRKRKPETITVEPTPKKKKPDVISKSTDDRSDKYSDFILKKFEGWISKTGVKMDAYKNKVKGMPSIKKLEVLQSELRGYIKSLNSPATKSFINDDMDEFIVGQ